MIVIRNMSVAFGAFVLRDIDLELHRGRCLAILGPSGAGKTLLLETAMGARRPVTGEVLLDGRNVTALPPEARRIAYIPQDLALFPHLSVRDNVVFGLPSRAARRNPGAQLQEIARLLQIAHLLERPKIATLSGGEKQRIALARALMVRPSVLFLDEPTCSLDAAAAGVLMEAIRALRKELAMTIFLVTHNLAEASFLADDLAILFEGRIVQRGPCAEVFRRPRTVEIARFLAMRNILAPGSPVLHYVSTDGAAPPQAHAHGLRPEDIRILPPDDAGEHALPARVRDIVHAGAHALVELELTGGTRIVASLPFSQVDAYTMRIDGDVHLAITAGDLAPLEADHGPVPAPVTRGGESA
jgi:ABC-type sugar transport system ATPase subunit